MSEHRRYLTFLYLLGRFAAGHCREATVVNIYVAEDGDLVNVNPID